MGSTNLSIGAQTALEQSDIHCSPDGISGYARKKDDLACDYQAFQAAFFSPADCFARWMRFDSKRLAFCNSARRVALSPRPPRLIKYVNILMPDPGPFGETLRDASIRAIVVALLLNNPLGGCVESVVTLDTHSRVFCLAGIRPPLRSSATEISSALDATRSIQSTLDDAQQTEFLCDLCGWENPLPQRFTEGRFL